LRNPKKIKEDTKAPTERGRCQTIEESPTRKTSTPRSYRSDTPKGSTSSKTSHKDKKEHKERKENKEHKRARTEHDKDKKEKMENPEESVTMTVINIDSSMVTVRCPKDMTWVQFAADHTADYVEENSLKGRPCPFVIFCNGEQVKLLSQKLKHYVPKKSAMVVEFRTKSSLTGLISATDPMDDLRSSELAAIDVTHLAGDKEATLKLPTKRRR
jgi:hypothetical protein